MTSTISPAPLPAALAARQATRMTPAVIVLAIAFVSFLLISNALGARVCEVTLPWSVGDEPLRLTFSAALISFPFAYLFASVLTEVYGYRISRIVIWSGLAANLVMIGFLWLMTRLPTEAAWAAETGFTDEVQRHWYEAIAHMFLASVSACFVGEFANAATLARMKVAMHGRRASLRLMAGSALAAMLDTVVFVTVAFAYVLDLDAMARMAGLEFVFKCAMQWLVLPLTVGLAQVLKRVDGIDHYDVGTSLNPFRFRASMSRQSVEIR
ncbi:VUT family protein [Pandoraea sp. XY-2]|uniref:VUT family protein n=1 Tax=Pandoraea sp. XY-2 TaxID=2518599 RepID=UPI0013EEE441|nr:VUT family protein [Pandoraea sp. XY-2]